MDFIDASLKAVISLECVRSLSLMLVGEPFAIRTTLSILKGIVGG